MQVVLPLQYATLVEGVGSMPSVTFRRYQVASGKAKPRERGRPVGPGRRLTGLRPAAPPGRDRVQRPCQNDRVGRGVMGGRSLRLGARAGGPVDSVGQ